MNILVINQPVNNRGDESAHKALLRKIAHASPNVKVKVLFVDQNQNSINQFDVKLSNVEYVNVRSKKGFNKISMLALTKGLTFLLHIHPTTRYLLSLYNTADIVVCAPGGICMGGFQNWPHLRQLMFAKYLKRPIAYYGRSFGPFPEETESNRLFKKISLDMLNYFSFCSIRDKKTESLAHSLHINYVPTVDSAFLDSPYADIPEQILKLIDSENYITFVPNLLIWHYAYKNRISKKTVIQFYTKVFDCIKERFNDAKVVLLPQTFNYGTYDGDDIFFFKELANSINDSRIVVLPDCLSSDIQQMIISKSRCMIGARYHSIVFALNQAVPFVAFSYEHKITGLLETLGKNECCIDITNALDNEKNIIEAISAFRQKLTNITKDLSSQKKAKKIAADCFSSFYLWAKSQG